MPIESRTPKQVLRSPSFKGVVGFKNAQGNDYIHVSFHVRMHIWLYTRSLMHPVPLGQQYICSIQ